MCHAIRELMNPGCEGQPPLNGIVELDEKHFGGKPRYKKGVKHKRGKVQTSRGCWSLSSDTVRCAGASLTMVRPLSFNLGLSVLCKKMRT